LRKDEQGLAQLVTLALEGSAEERDRATEDLEELRFVQVPFPAERLFASPDPRLRRVAVGLVRRDILSGDDHVLQERAVWDEDALVRRSALGGVARNVDLTQRLLTSERPELRRDTLQAMWSVPDELVGTVQVLLDDNDPDTHGRAAVLLAKLDPSLEGLLQPLLTYIERTEGFDRGSAIRCFAQALAAQPSRAAERRAFVGLLTASDAETRRAALDASELLVTEHDEIAGSVLRALGDPELGRPAAEVLGRSGPATVRLIPELLALARTRGERAVSARAALALSRLGETGHLDEVRELLREPALHDPEYDVIRNPAVLGALTLDSIRTLGARAARLGPDLIAFASTCPNRGAALEACELFPLLGLGEDAERAACELSRHEVHRGGSWERETLARVVAALGGQTEAGLRLVLEAGACPERRWDDLPRVLSAMARGSDQLAARIEAICASEPALAANATCALEALGVVDERTLALLLEDLLGEAEDLRERAIGRIRMLGERASPILPHVLAALTTTRDAAQVACLEVLGPLAGAAEDEVRRTIARAMASADPEVVEAARMALTDLGGRGSRADRETGNLAADSIRHLACSVLPLLGAADGNTVFSPLSLFSTVLLLLRGARGETLAQICALLGRQADSAAIRRDAEAARQQLRANVDGFVLSDAAALFSQEGYPLVEEYLRELASAGVAHERVDFLRGSTLACDAINRWVSEATAGRIRDLVSELDPLTRFAIVSATHLLARWERPFSDDTRPGSFTLLDGSLVEVPLMFRQGGFRYARGPRFDLVALPYREGIADLFIVAPDRGFFRRVHDGFGMHPIEDLEATLEEGFHDLRMPPFKLSHRLPLTSTLAQLGFTQLQTGEVDLSGMLTTHERLVGKVCQEAMIDVNETGTEAAAATVVAHIGGVPDKVVVDRPFLFVLRHRSTRVPLFVGTVLDPR